MSTDGTAWLVNDRVELNSGLVAIIGARGSGKTALADILAAGASARDAGKGESSFLNRAAEHLRGATVTLEWADGATAKVPLQAFDEDAWDPPLEEVRYLSQHFVEKLCSAKGLATELKSAIERVVFDNSTDKYDTDSFDELADVLLDPIRRRRAELQEAIAETTQQVVREDSLIGLLPTLRRDREALRKQVDGTQRALAALLPKGDELRVQHLTLLERAVLITQARVDTLRRKEKALQDLVTEAEHISGSIEPRRLEAMRRRYAAADLTGADWGAFGMKFTGDVPRVISEATAVIQRALKLAIDGEEGPSKDLADGVMAAERRHRTAECGAEGGRNRPRSIETV